MYKVKVYSLPGLIYRGTIRVKNRSAQNIAKRMGALIVEAGMDTGTLSTRTGEQVMYRIQDTRQEEATNAIHP